MSQELTEAPRFSLVPANYDDAVKISKTLSASQLVPKDYQGKPENVFVAIAWGQELGLAPLQALQNIAVINGRPAIWGDAALAVCMAHPEFEDIEEKIDSTGSDRKAVCTIKRRGRTPVVRTFSVADAAKAGLWNKGGPWTQYPDRMLQLRARGFALRDAFPDAMRGFKIAEEVQDIPAEVDVTPPAGKPAIVMPRADAPTTAAVVEELGRQEDEANKAAQGGDQPAEEQPAAPVAEGVVCLSTSQLKLIRAKCAAAGMTDSVLANLLGVDKIEALPAARVNEVLDKIKAFAASRGQA
jgi:hypothetical protein